MMCLVKTWRNKVSFRGRTWSRRIQWLEDGTTIKLKLEELGNYKEVGVTSEPFAQTIWDRFKSGSSTDDAVSILGIDLPTDKLSRKASNERSQPTAPISTPRRG